MQDAPLESTKLRRSEYGLIALGLGCMLSGLVAHGLLAVAVFINAITISPVAHPGEMKPKEILAVICNISLGVSTLYLVGAGSWLWFLRLQGRKAMAFSLVMSASCSVLFAASVGLSIAMRPQPPASMPTVVASSEELSRIKKDVALILDALQSVQDKHNGDLTLCREVNYRGELRLNELGLDKVSWSLGSGRYHVRVTGGDSVEIWVEQFGNHLLPDIRVLSVRSKSYQHFTSGSAR
ncbi:MAG: hypothetical protein KBG84_09850 [Planctomycetes bacterium]|nr:hypothetical protein [Planctomycetota bacterium]